MTQSERPGRGNKANAALPLPPLLQFAASASAAAPAAAVEYSWSSSEKELKANSFYSFIHHIHINNAQLVVNVVVVVAVGNP